MKKLDGKTAIVTEASGDSYKAALINFGYIANTVLFTDEVVAAMN
ncbi:hypothetical protein [Nostoc sp.]